MAKSIGENEIIELIRLYQETLGPIPNGTLRGLGDEELVLKLQKAISEKVPVPGWKEQYDYETSKNLIA